MKDPLLAEYTPEELQLEYFLDAIEANPQEEFPPEAGAVRFKTGDEVIDRWEEQIAKGEDILLDCVPPEFAEVMSKLSRAETARVLDTPLEESRGPAE